jgi:AraC-like DNA-binding protein
MTPRHPSAPANNPALERQVTQLVDRVNALCLELTSAAPVPRLALTIEEAATCVAMSISQFRRVFIDGGLVKSVPMGERARAIDYEELRAAYDRYKAETRAS